MSTQKSPGTALAAQSAAEQGELATSITFVQMERMAAAIAKSGLFGVKTAEQALSLMLIAQAEGKHPALIARDFDIIQGRPAKKSEAMLRDFHQAGGTVEWLTLTDEKVEARFSHPQGGTAVIDWDMARAARAGLTQKDGSMYKKYARSMLRSRVASEGCRTVWPSCTSGMYTPEEGRDIAEERDITPTARVEAAVEGAAHIATALTEAERDEHFTAMGDAKTSEDLMAAFTAAWHHASDAKDENARAAFKQVYDGSKAELAEKAAS
jgi:hypothetical protein